MGSSEREVMAVAGCCISAGSSWHCSHPELDPGGPPAVAAVAEHEWVHLGAVEEGGLILAAAAIVGAAHLGLLTPCRTSSVPPQVVTYDGEASCPKEVLEVVADGGVAHYCYYNHKETCPSFF